MERTLWRRSWRTDCGGIVRNEIWNYGICQDILKTATSKRPTCQKLAFRGNCLWDISPVMLWWLHTNPSKFDLGLNVSLDWIINFFWCQAITKSWACQKLLQRIVIDDIRNVVLSVTLKIRYNYPHFLDHLHYSTLQHNWIRWMRQVNYANKTLKFLISLLGLGTVHFAYCLSCTVLLAVAANCSTAVQLTMADLLKVSFIVRNKQSKVITAV